MALFRVVLLAKCCDAHVRGAAHNAQKITELIPCCSSFGWRRFLGRACAARLGEGGNVVIFEVNVAKLK